MIPAGQRDQEENRGGSFRKRGKKRGKPASFQFGGGFDSKQFERSMNELGQKLGRLGKELGEQFSSAFDSSASGKNEDDGGEDTFVCVTDDEN